MYSIKMALSLGVFFALLGGSELVLAAGGSWSSLRQLPQKDSGVRLEQPVAVAVDAQVKRYYVVDAAAGQLVSFDQEGKFLSAFTAGGQLKRPVAMVRTGTGSLWVVERSSNELLYINPREKEVRRFTPRHADGSKLFLSRLAVDSRNRLYGLDRLKGQVVRLDDNLKVVQSFSGDAGFKGFTDFKLGDDRLWGLDTLTSSVFQLDLSGKVEKRIKLTGLEFPSALEVDRSGQFYLLDRHAGTVVVFSRNGEKKFSFLGKGKRPGQLWNGADLLFDWQERLCVVDEGSGRVEIFSR